MPQSRQFPPMPKIGQPESYYAAVLHKAEEAGDNLARAATKVGQYITLAMDPHITWAEKLRYFEHTLNRHCVPPPFADDDIAAFYRRLTSLVRQHAGQEALRLVCEQDDIYATRLALGQPREEIENEAEEFFSHIITTDSCPDWFNEQDWAQLKMVRDQWI